MTSRPFRLDRRAVLRGAGGAVIALPLLEAMLPRRYQNRALAAAPARFIAFSYPNGYIRGSWTLTGSLAPLAKLQSKLLIVDGLTNVAAQRTGGGDDHMRGMGTLFTGAGIGSGTSLDQFLAPKLSANLKFPSLELGVNGTCGFSSLCYAHYNNGKAVPIQSNPAAVFSRIFADLPAGPAMPGAMPVGPDPALERLRLDRKSVLDGVARMHANLIPKLGKSDQDKIASHMNTIRDLEKRLLQLPTARPDAPAGGSCSRPPMPAGDTANDSHPATGKAQMDLTAMAFKCDLTRVAALQWSRSAADVRFTWLNINRGHHSMSHDGDGSGGTQAQLAQIDKWYVEQFAYLGGLLDAVPEGSGTMLDNTILVLGNELAKGNAHNHSPQPFLVLGGGNLGVKGGRTLAVNGTPHNNLLLSIANACGVPETKFGAFSTGPLTGFQG